MQVSLVILALLLLTTIQSVRSAPEPKTETDLWRPLVRQLAEPQLDTIAIELDSFVISKIDFSLELGQGVLYLFEPIVIEGHPIRYGGYFVGQARFKFSPPIRTEQGQLQRFFDSDSIDLAVKHMIILGDPDLFAEMATTTGKEIRGAPGMKGKRYLEVGLRAINHATEFTYAFNNLRQIVFPQAEPALYVQGIIDRFDQVIYDYNPLAREEVGLYKIHAEADGPELVCRYYQFVDESLDNINGERKDLLEPVHYDINALIDNHGELLAEVLLTCVATDETSQFPVFGLHHEAKIDTIALADGTPVEWFRESREALKSPILALALPSAPIQGDTLRLRFKYHGKIARSEMGLFFVSASANWYPRLSFGPATTYRMRFRSPGDYKLVASANLIDSSRVGDTLVTNWETTRKEYAVTFNLAGYEVDSIKQPGLPLVKMYYNRPYHEQFARDFDADWPKRIAPPVLNSLRLFSQLFGPIDRRHFGVTESLLPHAESFPGQINLPAWTYAREDTWGVQWQVQAHEVAHQWWGGSVRPETYHDMWLAEGLAEYSALLSLKVERGDELFYEKLREYRDRIMASRRTIFSPGTEAGPIIQGYRTSSSKTEEDYQLIIYQKAALVLHMLRCHLTDWEKLDDTRFNRLLRLYYRRSAGRITSTIEFKQLLEESTGEDWTWFFDQWVYGDEYPTYKFDHQIKKDQRADIWRVSFQIRRENVPEQFAVLMPVEIAFARDSVEYHTVVVREPLTEFALSFEHEPKRVTLNPFEAVLGKVEQ